jgi:hypothetical protein
MQQGCIYEYLESKNIKNSGFSAESLDFEKEKARIIIKHPTLKSDIFKFEDHCLLKGSIHNFDLLNHIENIKNFYIVFDVVWKLRNKKETNGLIVRALSLYSKSYDIWANNSGLGAKWFFGHAEEWETILTYSRKDPKINLAKFLIGILQFEGTFIERLETMIARWLETSTHKSSNNWLYYFAKYPEMTNSGYNLYSFKTNEANFELRNLTAGTLKGYHINPYVRTVAIRINDEEICKLSKCWTYGTEESPLVLENGIQLYCEELGWRIVMPPDFELSDYCYENFKGRKEDDKIYLIEDDKRDRVEVAIDFCKTIILA